MKTVVKRGVENFGKRSIFFVWIKDSNGQLRHRGILHYIKTSVTLAAVGLN